VAQLSTLGIPTPHKIMFSLFKRQPDEQPEPLQEFSTNFDPEMVRPFLERIQPFIESGFGTQQVEQVCQFVSSTPHDEERSLEFAIRHAGKSAKLQIRVFMDDIDAPDIYFFSPPALSQKIEAEYIQFADERGM